MGAIKHIFLSLWLSTLTGSAQNTMFLNAETYGEVISSHSEKLVYLAFGNTNKSKQNALNDDLDRIIFRNEKLENFTVASNQNPSDTTEPQHTISKPNYRNSISFNLFPIALGELALYYQRTFNEYGITLVLPVSFMLTDNYIIPYKTQDGIQFNKKKYDFGIGLYFNEKHKPRYFYAGPLFLIQEYTCQYSFTTSNTQGIPVQNVQTATLNRFVGAITNGYMFEANKRLSSTLFFSLGYRFDKFQSKLYDPTTQTIITTKPYPGGIYFWAGLNLGFNF